MKKFLLSGLFLLVMTGFAMAQKDAASNFRHHHHKHHKPMHHR